MLAITVVMLGSIMVVQFLVLMMNSTLQIIFLEFDKSTKNQGNLKKEIFNEIILMTIFYHAICFTDFVADPYAKKYIGYTCLSLNLIHLFVNLTLIILETY